MNETNAAPRKPASAAMKAVRWVVVVVIFVFLVRRLQHDWPTVRDALGHLRWWWITVSVIPGFLYFIPRVVAWRSLLGTLGVRVSFWQSGKIWINSEIIRYIPGNVWSVLGRVTQATSLGTSKTVVFSSMVLEALQLSAACAGLSAVLLIGFPEWTFPGRAMLLAAAAAATLLAGNRRVVQWFVSIVFRVLKRRDAVPVVSAQFRAYGWMLFSWLCFSLFQLCITFALGITFGIADSVTLMGAFLLSWLIGYLSFITPSGLGVREAAIVVLLRPFMGIPEAIIVAVVSRVFMILVEILGLTIVNIAAAAKPKEQNYASDLQH